MGMKILTEEDMEVLQYEESIVIGHSANTFAQKCDVFYKEGENFAETYQNAYNKCVEKGIKTIKLLQGEYKTHQFRIENPITLIGDGNPSISVHEEACILGFPFEIQSSNVAIYGLDLRNIGISLQSYAGQDLENIILENNIINGITVNGNVINSFIVNNIITESLGIGEKLYNSNAVVGNIINGVPQAGGAGGETVELDTTLTKEGKAADAKAVGDAIQKQADILYSKSKNILDLSKVIRNGNGNIDTKTGEIIEGTNYIYGRYPLIVGETYTFSKSIKAVYLDFYNDDGSYAGATNRIVVAGGVNVKTFTANYPYVSLMTTVLVSDITPQLELGEVATEYEEYYISLNEDVKIPIVGDDKLETEAKTLIKAINENKKNIDKLGEIAETDKTLTKEDKAADAKAVGDTFAFADVKGVNLLDMSKITLNKNFHPTTKEIIDSSSYFISDYIFLSGDTLVSLKGSAGDDKFLPAPARYWVAYDENDIAIDMVQTQDTYVVPKNAVKIRVSINNAYLNENNGYVMLFIGKDNNTPYKPYDKAKTRVSNISIYRENVYGANWDEIDKNKYNFRKVDVVCDTYSNNMNDFEYANLSKNSVDTVYSKYDELVETYPDYVTKTLLGTVNPDSDSLPIYRYDFIPKLPHDSTLEHLCKFLYCSGTHGVEQLPLWVGQRFFKDLCENWRTQDLLRVLRFNCQFTVIPLVNPYGFVYSTRTNENGVDLNRNFTKGWNNDSALEVGHHNYPGTGAASELSTQLIENMIANEHFDFGLDHHTYNSYLGSDDEKGKKKSGYFVSCRQRPEDVSFSDMMGIWMNAKTLKDNTLITDFSTSHFQTISMLNFGGYMFGAFPNGFCFENMAKWGYADEIDETGVTGPQMEDKYSSQKFSTETIGAIFYSAFVGYHTY